MSAPQQRTDEDCTLWYCPACRVSGVITTEGTEGNRGAYGVITAVREAHRQQSPVCESDQRAVRPTSWYAGGQSPLPNTIPPLSPDDLPKGYQS